MEVENSKKSRQGHRKSRKGCTTCKHRHIKCDEKRPQCTNCTISERECRYVAPKQAQTGTSPYEIEITGLSAFQPAIAFADSPTPSTSDLHEIESDELYTFNHLNLLYHIQAHMDDWMMVTDHLAPLANGYVTTGLKVPYLMNQLLALSSMHLRSLNESIDQPAADSYMQMATHLRHRALRGFNKCLDDTSEVNSTAQFFFASLLALHFIAEHSTKFIDQNFATTLDCMLNYFRLHRGVRVMGDRASTTINNSAIFQWVINASREEPQQPQTVHQEYEKLKMMLESSDLNEKSRKACEEATEALTFVMQRIQGPNSWGVHGLLAWSNLIPLHFLTLLERQTPEALVVLAHYAVLLHHFRTFWCLKDIGQRLIDGIPGSLAPYWTKWLPILGEGEFDWLNETLYQDVFVEFRKWLADRILPGIKKDRVILTDTFDATSPNPWSKPLAILLRCFLNSKAGSGKQSSQSDSGKFQEIASAVAGQTGDDTTKSVI